MKLGFCVSPALKNIACHPCHDYQITHQTLHTQFVVLENQWENILFFSNTVMARSDSMLYTYMKVTIVLLLWLTQNAWMLTVEKRQHINAQYSSLHIYIDV